MKSIREWRSEKGIEESFTRSAFQNTIGDGTVDPTIRLKLRNKIMEIKKDFPQMNELQLFQTIMSVVGQLLTKGSGTKAPIGKLYNNLNKALPQGEPSGMQGQANNSEEIK